MAVRNPRVKTLKATRVGDLADEEDEMRRKREALGGGGRKDDEVKGER